MTIQADQVVNISRAFQCLLDVQHRCSVLDLADLLGEDFRVVQIVAEEFFSDVSDFLFDLFLRLEQVGIGLHLIAKFRLQLFKIRLVGRVKLLADVGKVHHVAVPEILIWPVDSGQCLQEVMVLDNPPDVQLLKPLRVKACQ